MFFMVMVKSTVSVGAMIDLFTVHDVTEKLYPMAILSARHAGN